MKHQDLSKHRCLSIFFTYHQCSDIVNVNNMVVAMSTSHVAILISANHSPLLEGAQSVYKQAHIVHYSDFIS